MFNSIRDKLTKLFSSKNSFKTKEEKIKEIRKIFIDSDMTIECIDIIINDISEKWDNNPDISSTKLLNSSLRNLLVTGNFEYKKGNYLFLGPNGAGKTSFIFKLANLLKKKNFRVLVISLDNKRPAAASQLKMLCDNISVDFMPLRDNNISLTIQYVNNLSNYDIKLFDTAGQTYFENKNLYEMKKIIKEITPVQNLLVLNSLVGKRSIEHFKNICKELLVNGLVITNCDANDRGGFCISVSYTTKKPIYFISNGEKINDIEEFTSDNIYKMITGTFDVTQLQNLQVLSHQDEEKLEMNLKNGKMSFDDMISFLDTSSPFMDKIEKFSTAQNNQGNEMLGYAKIICKSMTKKERTSYLPLVHSRLIRISKGSGIPVLKVKQVFEMLYRIRDFSKIMQDPKYASLFEKGMNNINPQELNKIMAKLAYQKKKNTATL